MEGAKKVFPNAMSDEEAVDLLLDQIFKTCRKLYEEDPVKDFWKNIIFLSIKADMLNNINFQPFIIQRQGYLTLLAYPPRLGISCAINAQAKNFRQICQQRKSSSQRLIFVSQMAMLLLQTT